jgi:hypothetical protein
MNAANSKCSEQTQSASGTGAVPDFDRADFREYKGR